MIYVIEHAQTPMDAKGESHGGRDAPLNAKGRRQAVLLGVKLRNASPKPEVIHHSPKLRSQQTARIAGAVAGIPVRQSAALRPLRSGGLSAGPEPAASNRLIPYFRSPNRKIPGGESVGAWQKSHLRFMRRILADRRPAAAITHSNVVGSIRGGPEAARRAMAAPPQSAKIGLVLTHIPTRPERRASS